MRLFTVLLLLTACTTEPDVRVEQWAMRDFNGLTYVPWRTADTSANRLTIELAGSRLAGGARVTGEWWATIPGVPFLINILAGPLEGRYQVWGDTLFLRDVVDQFGRETWLSALGYTRRGNMIEGRWSEQDWWLAVRLEVRP